MTLVGSELGGATGLWTSLTARTSWPRRRAQREDQATFEVKVRSDAPARALRAAAGDRSGLSNVKLFLIDDLPTVAERASSPANGRRST